MTELVPTRLDMVWDPAQMRSFLAHVKAFEPALATSTRRMFRQGGLETMQGIKDQVLSPLPGQAGRKRVSVRGGSQHNIRQSIASSMSIRILTSAQKQGVMIVASGKNLSPQQKAMNKAYNRWEFRRQIFGREWTTQRGKPYFKLSKEQQARWVGAMRLAAEEALRVMRGK